MNATHAAQQLGISFRRYDAAEARQLSETVETVYRKSYIEAIASGSSFNSVEAFMARFESYSSRPDLDLVIAYHNDEPIGQTWGWPLRENGQWWNGLHQSEPETHFTDEDGRRTFALSEIMVSHTWTGKRVAHALHDTLLSARHELRATLLVRPDTTARRTYEHWGWNKVGQLRPNWEDAPTFDVMIIDLNVFRQCIAPRVRGPGEHRPDH